MIDFPTSPTIGDVVTSPDGLSWTWDGTTWLLVGEEGGGGDGGSGFTFVQEEFPTPTQQGDTWLNLSTGPLGGVSMVAIDEGSGELVWVQFAPGAATTAAFPPAVVHVSITAPAITGTFTPVPLITPATVHQPEGYFDVTANSIVCRNPGIYRVSGHYAFNMAPGAAASHYIHGYLEWCDPTGVAKVSSEHLLGGSNPYGSFTENFVCQMALNDFVWIKTSAQTPAGSSIRGGYITLERIA